MRKRTKEGVAKASTSTRNKTLWLFRIVASVFVPSAFFFLLESSLRLADYGYPSSALIKETRNDTLYFHDNPKFGYRFFARNLARESPPFKAMAKIPGDNYRIVVLGESAAQGTPEPAFSFGRMLGTMLRVKYPEIHFEVITAAMPAINSHVVLEIAKDFIPLEPDAIVCYMGNNEVVGPYGPGTVFSPFSSNLIFIRTSIFFKSLKISQLLLSGFHALGAVKEPDSQWQGMKMFLEKQVRFDDPALRGVYSHFEANLNSLARLCGKNGITFIASTVGTNLKDSPPFASQHKPDFGASEKTAWEALYQKGTALEKNGEYIEAISVYQKAARLDSAFADLQFRLGRCYWETGRFEEAKAAFKKARLFDTNRFRADDRINNILLGLSGRLARKAMLVDAEKDFEDKSPHGVPGNELFLDHVHLTFQGNFLLAKAVLKRIDSALPSKKKIGIPDDSAIGIEQCARHLAYNEIEEYKILKSVLDNFIKRPPFTNQLYHEEAVAEAENKLSHLEKSAGPERYLQAVDQYENALKISPSDWWLHWKYAELLASTDIREPQKAFEHYMRVREALPHYASAYVMAGLVSGHLGDFDRCIMLNRQALQIDPTIAEAYFNLGLAYQVKREYETAMEYYQRTLKYEPEHARAHNNLGMIHYQKKQVAEAIEVLREGTIAAPQYIDLHFNLAVALRSAGRKDEAMEALRTAIKIEPGNGKIRRALESLENSRP